MHGPEDPLQALREAWHGLETPDPAGGAEPDAATRASVAWLRSAWATVEIPAAPGLPRRRRLPALRAAALLLLAAGALLLPFRQEPAPAGPAAEAAVRQAAPPPASPGSGLVEVREDRVVLRSGRVRLTLLQPTALPADGES